MLFGKADPKEYVDISELEACLDRCLDLKLRRLSGRISETEASLAGTLSAFGASTSRFADSDTGPDMENLYGIKENSLRTQKQNYANSLLNLVSNRPDYGGSNMYRKGQSMLSAYGAFMTRVLKTNNTFKLVMIGYSGELATVKRHFNAMERLCKELGNELESWPLEIKEYENLHRSICAFLDDVAILRDLTALLGDFGDSALPVIDAKREIAGLAAEKERDLEAARRTNAEAKRSLSGLLLPLEKASRKHDHASASKRKIVDYIKDPLGTILGEEDAKALNIQLSEMSAELKSGTIVMNNGDAVILHIRSLQDSDILSVVQSVRRHEATIREAEHELERLLMELRKLEKKEEDERKRVDKKAGVENEIARKAQIVLSHKHDVEGLFLDYYRRRLEIKDGKGLF